MTSKLGGLLKGSAVCALVVGGMLLASAPNAGAASVRPAASGGGCGNTLSTYGGMDESCISATAYGKGVVDGYVSYYANQPGCTVTLTLWNSANVNLGGVSQPCPAGSTGVHPSLPFSANSGTYHSTLALAITGRATVTAYSPGLTMP